MILFISYIYTPLNKKKKNLVIFPPKDEERVQTIEIFPYDSPKTKQNCWS